MAYISEQMIFDYFQEENTTLSLDDLSNHFEAARLDDILHETNTLCNRGLLTETDNYTWKLSEKALRIIKESEEKERQTAETDAIELEKTKTDLELAKKMLREYPTTKWMARISFIIALCLAILELIRSLKR